MLIALFQSLVRARRIPALLLAFLVLPCLAQVTPACFKVTSGKGTAYVLGSIHAGRKDFYPLPAPIEQAWKDAEALAVEADTTNMEAMVAVVPRMMYTPPDNLEKHVKPATWDRVQQTMKDPAFQKALQGSGVPAQMLPMFRPWALTLTLAMVPLSQAGYDPASGIDMHFLQRAKQAKRPILEIESIAFQMDLLAGMPDAIQEATLLEALDGIHKGEAGAEMERLLTAWSKGDLAGLERLTQESSKSKETRTFMTSLLEGRNPGMAKAIQSYLQRPRPVFVVVGAAHLPGPKGVLALLKAKGCKVERL